MMVAIVVLLILVSVMLLGVIGLKGQLEDVRYLSRAAKKDDNERIAWLEERLKEERERSQVLRDRLAPFSAFRAES